MSKKWIVTENLVFYSLDDIGSLRLGNELFDSEGRKCYHIIGWDNIEKELVTFETLYLEFDQAKDYFISKMKQALGEENILLLDEE
jgi:hypothetical protein